MNPNRNKDGSLNVQAVKAAINDVQRESDLLESCGEMLALVVLRYGNLYPDVNAAIEKARNVIARYNKP